MTTLRITTFNVENLLARFKFSEAERTGLATLLDADSEVDRANLVRTYWNVLHDEERVFSALSIRQAVPEVVCLQEVDNKLALDAFHDRYLRRVARHTFPYRIVIEGNDPRGIDVAVLSQCPIASTTTHQHVEAEIHYPAGVKRERVFRRDCLEVHINKEGRILPIFVCHFKSMAGGRVDTRPIRAAEAAAVRHILVARFGDPAQHDWLVVGDLNDYTETDGVPDRHHGLGPLVEEGFAVDLVKRIPDPCERWTHFFAGEGSYHQLDYLLASPALAAKNPEVIPQITRQGQPYRAERYTGHRWPRVGYDRPKASDHCPVTVDLAY
jgi:endonuclease/exonuclease/phosphatase family metal-dependent hydrolase